MKYIRTKDGRIITPIQGDDIFDSTECKDEDILRIGELEELCDEFVILENGHINNVTFLPEAKDRLLEYHEMGNYEPRLIGRIKVGLDIKAIAEFKELTEGKYKGCYDWVLL